MYDSIRKNSLLSAYQLLRQIACLAILFMLFSLPVYAAEDEASSSLKEILMTDIDELGNIPVYIYSASKKDEKLWETAAAAYVISTSDIQRSGVTTIPELLRMVPGLFIGSADASTRVLGSRGFASEYTKKMLVLIDGRSVYNSILGGVYWNVQDIILEDIKHIEKCGIIAEKNELNE